MDLRRVTESTSSPKPIITLQNFKYSSQTYYSVDKKRKYFHHKYVRGSTQKCKHKFTQLGRASQQLQSQKQPFEPETLNA